MKRMPFCLLALAALLLPAHPPKAVELSYSADTGTLSVKVPHPVSDQNKHFVQRIEVRSGKDLLAEKSYTRQETAAAQSDLFLFVDKPLQRGMAVTVTAFCNLSGKRSAELKWE